MQVELLRAAAELAAGVPELTWKAIDVAPGSGADPASRALAGWNALREASEGSVRREWDLLRRVHPSAQSVAAAMSRPKAALGARGQQVSQRRAEPATRRRPRLAA